MSRNGMFTALKAKVEFLESVYIPFTDIILPTGTVVNGYYDGIGLIFFNSNVCYQIPLQNVKCKIELGKL